MALATLDRKARFKFKRQTTSFYNFIAKMVLNNALLSVRTLMGYPQNWASATSKVADAMASILK